MKKRFLAIVYVLTCTTFLLTGCSNKEILQTEVNSLEIQKAELQKEIDELIAIRDGLVSKDDISYVVTLKISQSHFTLDLDEHLKDALNDIEIPIEVSESYYYSVEIGDEINSDLRVGSLIFKGSIGSWDITVKDKQIVTLED